MDILKKEVLRHDIKKITKIRLKIGQFTAIEPSSLSFCFQILSEKTLFEGADIEIDEGSGNELDIVSLEAE